MNLYLIRHADAGDRDQWFGEDANRPLSDLGRRQAEALGRLFRARGLAVDAVACSPLARTRQTAEAFLDGTPGVPTHDSFLLTPDGLRRRRLSRELAGLGADGVAVIGHNPDLSAYLAWLIGAGEGTVSLEKGGAALVVFDGGPKKGTGRLAWVVTPEWYAPAEEPTGVSANGPASAGRLPTHSAG